MIGRADSTLSSPFSLCLLSRVTDCHDKRYVSGDFSLRKISTEDRELMEQIYLDLDTNSMLVPIIAARQMVLKLNLINF